MTLYRGQSIEFRSIINELRQSAAYLPVANVKTKKKNYSFFDASIVYMRLLYDVILFRNRVTVLSFKTGSHTANIIDVG